MKKWLQITFSMDSGDVVTTDWQETAHTISDEAPFDPFQIDTGPFAPDLEGLKFVGFPCRDYEDELLYVRPSKVESFRVEFRESEDKPK